MEDMVKLGPSQLKGTTWDDGGKTAIVQILISYDTYTINSIQFVYAVKEKLHCTMTHGQLSLKFSSVIFDYPTEFLTSVSGKFLFEGDRNDSLASITFGTNIRKYGPFGMIEDDTNSDRVFYDFNYEFGAKDFGGFHGSDRYGRINSIGIYIKQIRSLPSESSNVD